MAESVKIFDRDGEPQGLNIDSNGNLVTVGGTPADPDVQAPTPISASSVYKQDLWPAQSTVVGWVDLDDSGEDNIIDIPFTNLHTSIQNSSVDAVKTLLIHFNRTVNAHQVGVGADTGNFSNVKLTFIGSGHVERTSLDDSDNDTKYTSKNYQFTPALFNALKIEFSTTDTVTLSNITIQKSAIVESQIKGVQPSGSLVPIGATAKGNLKIAMQEYGDTPSIDPFDRLRVSNPYTLFDSKQIHDKQPLFWDEITAGSATAVHTPTHARTRMTVTAASADNVIRQTKQRFNYQPGKGQLILMTFLAKKETGVTKRIGVFDGIGGDYMTANNGIFFEVAGTTLSWNIAKGGSTVQSIAQANWNVDTLDGSGDAGNQSGIALNTDGTQIAIIDYEWLGVGRVRVGFVIDGIIQYVHYFNHANDDTFDAVYMSTPNLPCRYDVESDGSGGGSLDHICSSVMSEGGIEETGILRSVDCGTTELSASNAGTTYAVKGIRLKTAYNDVTVIPEFFSMINEATDDLRWSICLNPTIAGTFTYSDVANSAIQEATGVTANTISDEGLVIDSGYAVAGNKAGGGADRKLVTSLRIGSKIDGTMDEVVLCVTPLTGGADILGSLTFREML